MGAYIMAIVLDAHKKSHLFQFLNDCGPGFITVHSCKFSAVFINGGIIVHNIDFGQVMSFSHLKVIRVMSGCDLYHAGAKFHIHIGIRHNGDLTVHQGQKHLPADEGGISFVLRINSHCGISQHGFRTCGGKFQEFCCTRRPVFLQKRVFDMPEMAGLFFVYNLCIGDGGVAHRAPVYNSAAFINPAFFMHFTEHFRNRLIAALIHGEAFSVPVAGGPQLAELAGNPAAVFLLPFPCAFQEFLPSQIVLVNAFFLQLFDDFYFRCNAGVIRSRLPECIIALHTLKTYQYILHGIIQGVSHMELSRNIRRGHHNGEGLFAPIHLRMKIFLLHPFLIQPVLYSMRIICFCKFFTHSAPFCVQAAFQSEFFKAQKSPLPIIKRQRACSRGTTFVHRKFYSFPASFIL